MPSRELHICPLPTGDVRFSLTLEGSVPEAQISDELTSMLVVVDPALDSYTGRLIPGRLAEEIATSIVLTDPDPDGFSHIAGMDCPKDIAGQLARLAKDRGYNVVGDV